MADALERVLQLVAAGRLTAAEAEPILAALGVTAAPGPDRGAAGGASEFAEAKVIRIAVTEGGRLVLNLRVPLALGRYAAERIPGLSDANAERIRRAIELGLRGPIVEAVDADGDGVRIAVE